MKLFTSAAVANFTFLPFYFFTFSCCKGTKNINAKQYFPPIIFKKFQMLKFAPEITLGGAENHVEKFRKSRRKTENNTWKSRGNRLEKFRKSRGKVSTFLGKESTTSGEVVKLFQVSESTFSVRVGIVLP